MCEYLEVGL